MGFEVRGEDDVERTTKKTNVLFRNFWPPPKKSCSRLTQMLSVSLLFSLSPTDLRQEYLQQDRFGPLKVSTSPLLPLLCAIRHDIFAYLSLLSWRPRHPSWIETKFITKLKRACTVKAFSGSRFRLFPLEWRPFQNSHFRLFFRPAGLSLGQLDRFTHFEKTHLKHRCLINVEYGPFRPLGTRSS